LRINGAADDAAGLQIANRLTGQINGMNQGIRNANDGISLAQTAEGALDEMSTMYQRILTLASQASNGSNTDSDRAALQLELRELGEEINRISTDTSFGGTELLDGSFSAEFQVGANSGQVISMTMTAVSSFDGSSVTMNSLTVSDVAERLLLI
jgi:flagellin